MRRTQTLQGTDFDPGEGLCTYQLTRQKLALAAADAGLPEPNHTALTDARTVALLATSLGLWR